MAGSSKPGRGPHQWETAAHPGLDSRCQLGGGGGRRHTERKNGGSVRAQPYTNACLSTSQPQNFSSPTAGPLPCPTRLPKGIRCLSKLGNQSELRLQEFLTLAHTPLIGRDSFPITHQPPGFCLCLFHLVNTLYVPHPGHHVHIYSEGAATTQPETESGLWLGMRKRFADPIHST